MYSPEFELDVLTTAFQDRKFLSQYCSRIDEGSFTNEIYGTVWAILQDLWDKYHEKPTFTALKSEIEAAVKDGYFYEEDVKPLAQALKAMRKGEVMRGWTTEKVEKWLSERAHERFAAEAQGAVIEGNPQVLHVAYRQLTSALARTDDERDFFDRWEEIAAESARFAKGLINTTHQDLDIALGGGYAKGDFGMIWGIDGIGKSWFAIQLGMDAVTQGFRVLHLSNEMLKKDVEARYLALFTNINADDLAQNLSRVQALQKHHLTLKGLLQVEYMQDGTDIMEIRNILEDALADEEQAPYDVVIIDYVDKFDIKGSNESDWLRLEKMFAKLADFTKISEDPAENPAILAVTHTNAEAQGKALPNERKAIGRSRMGKSKNVDFSIAMGQDKQWKEKDIVQATVTKFPRRRRTDPKRRVCLLKFDRATGSFTNIGFEQVDTE